MTEDLASYAQADLLAAKIHKATARMRLDLHPAFSNALQQLERSGQIVPLHLRNLHEQLLDEAFEARFDKLPA